MKFTTTIQKGPYAYISLPENMAKSFIDAGTKRIICKINRNTELHRAIQSSKDFGYYIMLGKSTLKSANLTIGQSIEVELVKDETAVEALIPEALDAVLKSDFEAYEAFNKLTPGKKRSIMYLVTGVKSEQKQVERALKIMENIKIGITKPKDLLK